MAAGKPGRPRKHPAGKKRRSEAERRGQTKAETAAKVKAAAEAERELEKLETVEDKILWYATHGVEPRDIATKLGLHSRLAADAAFKAQFDELVERGLADMRIMLARTLIAEASVGQVTALKEAAKAHLEAYSDAAPSTEFAGGYRARVEEMLSKIHDEQHEHVRRKFKFEE